MNDPQPTHDYFAFGANMCDSVLARRAISPLRARAAALHDHALRFRTPGIRFVEPCFASVHPEPGSVVHGVLYTLSDADMQRLDRYEEPGYDRRTLMVEVRGAGPVPAVLYITREEVSARRPSRRYVDLLIRGALEHELPADYVRTLRSLPTFTPSRFVPSFAVLIAAFERAQRLHPAVDRAVKRLYRWFA